MTPLSLERRRAGKIARLPEPIREQINLMLQDGVPYATIIARLADPGKGLNKDNLSRWRKAQYQDWLWEQRWAQASAGRPHLPPATKQMCRLLDDLEPRNLQRNISRHPAKLITLLNLLGKFSRSARPLLHITGTHQTTPFDSNSRIS